LLVLHKKQKYRIIFEALINDTLQK